MTAAPSDEDALRQRLLDYRRKAKVLRQINSNKMLKTRRKENLLDYGTIVVSLVLTFMAFFGVQRIHTMFLGNIIDLGKLELMFNCLVLVVLILSFMQITLKFGEKELEHLNSIKVL